MSNKVHSRDLFAVLRRMIPNIPEKTTKLTITLELNEAARFTCEAFAEIGESGEFESKQYTLSEVSNEHE